MARKEIDVREGADASSVRNAIRWGLLLAAVGTVGFRVPRLLGEFRQWRAALGPGDAGDAQSWHAILEVDLVACLVVLALGVAAFYFLRPHAKATR